MPYFPEIFTCDCCHPPIAHTCQYCPVCDAQRQIDEHEKENDDLRERVLELEEHIKGLQMQPVNGGRHE